MMLRRRDEEGLGMYFTDRYQALGIGYPDPDPDPKTMCKGHCEGIGMYPLFLPLRPPRPNQAQVRQDYLPHDIENWYKAHKRCTFFWRLVSRFKHLELWYWKSLFEPCDGWHFIECHDCGGTGKSR